MSGLIWLIVAIVVVVIAFRFLEKSQGRDNPYEKKPGLFSPAERSFLGVLDAAVGSGHRVFAKVRVADVVDVKRVGDQKRRSGAFNRISSKHFDFVVCRVDDLSIVCAVELDDRSHGSAARKSRDLFLEEMCKAIGLPLMRIPARRSYSVEAIRQEFDSVSGIRILPSVSPSGCP